MQPLRRGLSGFMAAMKTRETEQGMSVTRLSTPDEIAPFSGANCINNADENGLEHGLFSWASGLGRIVGRRVGVVAA